MNNLQVTNRRCEMLFSDPHLSLLSFPYNWLNQRLKHAGKKGIGPETGLQEIKDVMFELMESQPVLRQDREAWDRLRSVDQRLAIDFWMYNLPAEDEELFPPMLWSLEMPLYLPEFMGFAQPAPDFANSISIPEIPAPGELPRPLSIDRGVLQAAP